MLKYLIEDSKPNNDTGECEKYKLADAKLVFRYIKSRTNKDIWGNNPFHYLWDIDIESVRKEMLGLLIKWEVGSSLKHNKMGMLPHYVDHRFSYKTDIPDELKSHFKDI